MWTKPYSYKEGTVVAIILMLLGILVQMCIGPISWDLIAWPANAILLVAYLAILIIMYTLRHKVYILRWSMHLTAAVPSIAVCAIITLVYGVTNWEGTLSCWAFVLIYLWITTIVGLVSIKRIVSFFEKNAKRSFSYYISTIAFLLNHLGLFIAITTATLGNADLQKLKMQVETGQREWRALEDETSKVVELPIAIQLNSFSIEEYPAKLTIANTETNSIEDKNIVIEDTKHLPNVKVGEWTINVKKYYEYCTLATANDSIYYESGKENGATTAAYVIATHDGTGKRTAGWVSNGSSIYPYRALELDGKNVLIMEEREAKRYASEVEVFTESGSSMNAKIEVNKPLYVEGWKIYQLSYDTTQGRWSQISVFELVRDPWLPFVYTGIYMLIAGAILQFITAGKRKEEEHD